MNSEDLLLVKLKKNCQCFCADTRSYFCLVYIKLNSKLYKLRSGSLIANCIYSTSGIKGMLFKQCGSVNRFYLPSDSC